MDALDPLLVTVKEKNHGIPSQNFKMGDLQAKVMSIKHKMPWKDVIAAYNEPVILSLHCEAEQCPKPLFLVVVLLLHLTAI